jgi:hypothetical protein
MAWLGMSGQKYSSYSTVQKYIESIQDCVIKSTYLSERERQK